MAKTLKIEWDFEPTQAEFSEFESDKSKYEGFGYVVELIGKRPNDRG